MIKNECFFSMNLINALPNQQMRSKCNSFLLLLSKQKDKIKDKKNTIIQQFLPNIQKSSYLMRKDVTCMLSKVNKLKLGEVQNQQYHNLLTTIYIH